MSKITTMVAITSQYGTTPIRFRNPKSQKGIMEFSPPEMEIIKKADEVIVSAMIEDPEQPNSFIPANEHPDIPVLFYDVSVAIRNENFQVKSDVEFENLESLEYVDLLVQNLVRAGLLDHVNIEYN